MSHYFLRSSFLDIVGLSSIDLLKSSGDPVGHFYVIVIIKQTTHSCAFIQKRTLPIARDEEIFTRCCLIFIQKQNILQTLETCYIWWSCFEPIAFYWCFQWRSPIILAFSRRLPNLMTTMDHLHFQMFQTFQAYQIISGDLLSYHRPHSWVLKLVKDKGCWTITTNNNTTNNITYRPPTTTTITTPTPHMNRQWILFNYPCVCIE